MAKELGFQPKSLIKNIPAPSQQWKMPVKQWVRLLHEDKFGSTGRVAPASARPEHRQAPVLADDPNGACRADDDVPF